MRNVVVRAKVESRLGRTRRVTHPRRVAHPHVGVHAKAVPLLIAGLALSAIACTRVDGHQARYAEALAAPAVAVPIESKLTPPVDGCLAQAKHFVRTDDDLLKAPLPQELQDGYEGVLRNLHPVAQKVMQNTHGVWLANHVPGAAARFIPCELKGKASGIVLVDVNAYPLDEPLREVEVPRLYWQLLTPDDASGTSNASPAHTTPTRSPDRAIRYVLLHELGHALSLLSGEFQLDPTGKFRPGPGGGFLNYSWRADRGAIPSDFDISQHNSGFVPNALASADWFDVRKALDAEPTLLAPGYRRPGRLGLPPGRCRMLSSLPRAGFVTPAAAISPTEDYAELFAHAILASEGKIATTDVFSFEAAGCHQAQVAAPYYADGVKQKREYLERVLDL